MRKYRSASFASAVLALTLASQAMAAPPIVDRPGCRGALDGGAFIPCAMKTERGVADGTGSGWQSHGQSGEQASEYLDPFGENVVTVRGLTPLGATYEAGKVTYEVQFEAGVSLPTPGALGAVQVSMWLGDDQGGNRVQLVERQVTFGGDAIGPIRISASGQNVGFEPNFLYVSIRGAAARGFEGNGTVTVRDVRAGIRPTDAP